MSISEIIITIRHVTHRMTPAEVERMRVAVATRFVQSMPGESDEYWLGCIDGAIGRDVPVQFDDDYLTGFHKYASPAARAQTDRRWQVVEPCVAWKRRNGRWCNQKQGMIYDEQS